VYKLIFSKLYHSDLDECYIYISKKLENPMAAEKLIIETKKKLIEIKNNPTHRPLVNDEYLADLGYRLKIVKNFMIFYIIDNDNKHIKIVRFLYGKRDWMNILKEKTIEEMYEKI
jgi:toxin ParE1/3/4